MSAHPNVIPTPPRASCVSHPKRHTLTPPSLVCPHLNVIPNTVTSSHHHAPSNVLYHSHTHPATQTILHTFTPIYGRISSFMPW
ncbi:MAG: hypothetical protein IJG37_07750 [Synergistaceae bacterium]|nr:hypothetical protein [Synergistaceae bacterium]